MGSSYHPPGGGGSGSAPWVVANNTPYAAASGDKVLAYGAGALITLPIPASQGDEVQVIAGSDGPTFANVSLPNGSPILKGGYFVFVYDGSGVGWVANTLNQLSWLIAGAGILPVADSTYTLGIGVTQNGTETTQMGIATAIVQAS